jgi:protein TonB
MAQVPTSDVFSLDEVARAVGVPRATVAALASTGDLAAVPGTIFFASAEVVRLAPALRAAAARTPPLAGSERSSLWGAAENSTRATRPNRLPLIASSCAHTILFMLLLALRSGTPHAAAPALAESSRLVFLMIPGQAGGGGGGGADQARPVSRLERRGGRASISAPVATPDRSSAAHRKEPVQHGTAKPVERAPEPLAARTVIAPVVLTAANTHDREGVTERPASDAASQGPGTGGSAGDGRGLGNGEGRGSGIGPGSGGGVGGGPYRPGSGIQPPRLLREVKAEYTEDARRRGVTGDVILEIIVRRDGGVGDVTVLRGLAAGLDQRAIAAVRQWQFAPARRLGEPVDVVVEVSVEFSLR